MNIWVTFIFLQLMDVLTTIIFLNLGLEELNFIIRKMINLSGSPWGALWKLPAVALLVALGLIFRRQRLSRVLSKINYFYAAIVLWNAISIAAFTLATRK